MKQESPADAVKPARRKSMQKLLQFDVFRLISPNSNVTLAASAAVFEIFTFKDRKLLILLTSPVFNAS